MLSRSFSRLGRRLCFYYRQVGFRPLPEKKETGGEDAFLCTGSVQSVLDGVSWWRDNAQVDAGLYSAAMARSMHDYIEEDLLGDLPASSYRLLEYAYEECKHSEVQGTCTALVATLQEPQPDIHEKDGYTYADLSGGDGEEDGEDGEAGGSNSSSSTSTGVPEPAIATRALASRQGPETQADNHLLDVVFVGDCSMMLLREGKLVYVTEEQQHDLDYPYQLGTGSNDTPADGVRLLIPVQRGDVLIMGSDGIFDNVYPDHIASIVWEPLAPVYKEFSSVMSVPTEPGRSLNRRNRIADELVAALRTGTDKLLEVATTYSKDIHSNTPYASKCIEGGALYEGGKPDDMTVLISIISDEDSGTSGERFSGSLASVPEPYRDWP